jgi:dTDP-L-rhamnose 4-epimerase
MRILLTGGAGFIGSHIAELLGSEGHDVAVLDTAVDAHHIPPHLSGFTVRRGDIRDPDALRAALDGVDVVCHQAAMVGLETSIADMPGYVSHNDHGTAQLLAEVEVHRLVLASSMVVYGEGRYTCPAHGTVPAGPRTREDLGAGQYEPRCPACGSALNPALVPETAPLDPRNAYAVTKATQEHLASVWSRNTGGSATALRYHNVYGPRMPRDTPYAGVASLFCSALARGQSPQVFEDGGQRRDFVHVRDVARANSAAITREQPGFAAYNICSGRPRTIADMAGELSRATAGPAPVTTGRYRLGDVRHITADPQRSRDELGFRAETPFADGMAELGAVLTASAEPDADRADP